jgi:hypothetical protein
MNWEGCGMKETLPNLRYFPGISLGGARKTEKPFYQDIRCSSRDLNRALLEHKSEAIQLETTCPVFYEGELVNRSEMDIQRKTCDNRTRKKKLFFRHILHQHWYTCPVRRNPQHTSLLTVVLATSTPPFKALRPWEDFSTNLCTALRNKHFSP